MPHLSIQYSANLGNDAAVTALCQDLSKALANQGIYPLGGIRVRAFPAPCFAIADHHPENAFIDMVFRIGAGRSASEKKATGEALMTIANHHFAERLKGAHFALSLEIVEIDPQLSWKINTIHPRLHSKNKDQS